MSMKSRREFIVAAGSGLTAASCARRQLDGVRSATPADTQGLVGDGRKRRILLRGGVVLSLDPKVGDFEKADVLIDGKMIAAGRARHLRRRCRGGRLLGHDRHARLHHHAPSPVRDAAAEHHRGWPACRARGRRRAMGRWFRTSGRRAGSPIRRTRAAFIWDLGRVPYDPEDCYISELVACLSEISEGVTLGTDTSQANHTPEHTDAMIKGLMDSGRRMVFDYSGGTNRSAEGIPFEVPRRHERHDERDRPDREDVLQLEGSAGDARLRRRPGAGVPGRAVHRVAARPLVRRVDQQPHRRQPDGDRQCGRRRAERHRLVRRHVRPRTRWQDKPVAQIGAGSIGLPERQPIESVGDLCATGARTSRSPTSSRCRCGTGCRRFRRR